VTTNEVSISRLSAHDAQQFMELRLLALQTDPDAYLSTFESESGKTTDDFARELEYAKGLGYLGYYGVWSSGQDDSSDRLLIGYCQIATTFLAKQEHVLMIHNLYVKQDFRGRGLAKKLIDYLLGLAKTRGIEVAFLSCNGSNVVALDFYKKCGFVECGRKPKSLKWQGKFDDEVELWREV
jgi:ribosomal protein S18 acetylase RimI-like enzyme